MAEPFIATLEHGEAVLRFPFDERLKLLLRAIPGRRWDPQERVWRLPLDPERAHALAMFLAAVPGRVHVSAGLARTIERRRARRRERECVLDLARPDENWWLSFATDASPEVVEALLEHPDGYSLPAIGRALIPLDERAFELVAAARETIGGLTLTDDAEHGLTELGMRGVAARASAGPGSNGSVADGALDAELRRDRRGEQWILIAGDHAPLARNMARDAGIRALDGSAGTVGLAATQEHAPKIAQLLAALELENVDPKVTRWVQREATWRGSIEVYGPRERALFLLVGDASRLPAAIADVATATDGGVSLPLTRESWELIDGRLDGWISGAASRCIRAVEEGRLAPPAVLERSTVHEEDTFVLAPGHDPELLDRFAELPGALPPLARGGARSSAGEHARLPAIRADPFCVPQLDALVEDAEVWVDPDALALLQEIREEHAHAAGLVALSAATDGALEVPRLGGELKPFQRAGASYLLAQRRAFLADEQGLGKTIEAIATLESDGAYPAIVVCPASLKLNWLRELEHWVGHRRAVALTGTSSAQPLPRADVTVVNYDIVAARVHELSAIAPRALVLDESHYCKNPGAKRTRAVQQLAASVPRDGLILALTGTPVMNRPPELISQLRILGRLADFGSGAQFGRRFRGPDAHQRLHWHLRARCFARRLKADVLPQLPAKTRAVVPVELSNEPEYRLAEHDIVAWLRSQPLDLRELDQKVAAALRAERLVRLNALKLLAARGKLNAALAWIHDFLSSGERLVVFAAHREIQRAVVERFPSALHILGEDGPAARDASLQAFQQADSSHNQLIVCSIEVAGHGITLTRSSNVAFLELDWTPAKHDQAEDRCHRIGQQDAVNATYLLAADTIDETIATLLERKRAVIGAVTDGRDEDDSTIVDALVRDLRGEPYERLRAVA